MKKLNLKSIYVSALVLVIFISMIGPAFAAIQAQIIPPSPYTIYTNQTYSLSVPVQYDIPDTVDQQYGPYNFWISSPPSQSGQIVLHGSGTSTFSLMLQAPSTPGIHTLGLKLYVQASGQQVQLMDTTTVTYQVIEPVVTDWEVEKVWTEPKSPGEGDQVTFHATIILKSTTSNEPLVVEVACYLDQKFFASSSLTFQPKPGTRQNIAIPKQWTAIEGLNVLLFIVDRTAQHNDPTPYPTYNFMEHRFTVEPYYAIIQRITPTPSAVHEGERFEVTITVEYRFPGSASLKVKHLNNGTLPPVNDEQLDTVNGSGTKDYTFTARAGGESDYSYLEGNRSTWTSGCRPWALMGQGTVEFDKGDGWEHSDPGWVKSYTLNVTVLEYYAEFDLFQAATHPDYPSTSESREESENGSLGRIAITLQIRYLLPLESGLRITVTRASGTNASIILMDESTLTQEESVERIATYSYEYTFPLSSVSSETMTFYATVEYDACGRMNVGDSESVDVSVPITEPASSTPDYFGRSIERIIDWFKKFFG